jgi:hypothetical protein
MQLTGIQQVVPSDLRCLSVSVGGLPRVGPYLLYRAASTQGSGWPAIEIGLQVEGWSGWLGVWEGYAGLIACNRKVEDTPPGLPVLVPVLTTVNAVMTQIIVAGTATSLTLCSNLAYSVHAVASSLTVINDALIRGCRGS